ncbi:hypothetical protein AGOR_G00007380 [Albula goreensis]|uniref:Uncharacterized protein n=1 Tax=Albula goreensis TaxID=1534307 RepID=A0A8T3E5A7_9TELE|nr:hypothetical protein AGOR_G00007380 [Albula goreensis]
MKLLDPTFGTVVGFWTIVVILIAVFLSLRNLDVATNTRMEHDVKTLEENFRENNLSCFILGASGETGKELVKDIVSRKIFSRITLIGRRELKFEDNAHQSLIQKVVDFEKLND